MCLESDSLTGVMTPVPLSHQMIACNDHNVTYHDFEGPELVTREYGLDAYKHYRRMNQGGIY